MKYKYQFKNKELEEALGVIFGEEYVENQLQEQMPDGTKYLYIEIDEPEGIKSSITIPKEEVERVRDYDPDCWNPFPTVTPPKEGVYLISLRSVGEPYLTVDKYVFKFGEYRWNDSLSCDVLAFRPLNVEPPAPEEL
mgnify:CR=1 FL=1